MRETTHWQCIYEVDLAQTSLYRMIARIPQVAHTPGLCLAYSGTWLHLALYIITLTGSKHRGDHRGAGKVHGQGRIAWHHRTGYNLFMHLELCQKI